jgi:hypothetical protein
VLTNKPNKNVSFQDSMMLLKGFGFSGYRSFWDDLVK